MTTGPRCLLALCSLLLLCTFVSRSHAASCCLSYTRRPPPCKKIEGFSVQSIGASCDLKAVIFRTKTRFICADPESPLTRDRLDCLGRRRQARLERVRSRGHSTDS